MNVLITGATGVLGTVVSRYWSIVGTLCARWREILENESILHEAGVTPCAVTC